ncbi:MAG TPA: GNAT family N-acetyltransferase [Hyphomicrobium sp.]|nr:GNAT family N-acetyltransferase [Hyphomicrobium sp.]
MSVIALACERPALDEAAPPVPFVSQTVAHATLDLVSTRDGFDALETSWNALFERAGRDIHLFQTFNWLWHWANHFLPAAGERGATLAIVTAHIDGRLVLVLPLVAERVGPLTQLEWMGEPVGQYGDALIDTLPDGEGAALLRAALDFAASRTGAGALRLRRVREDSNIAPLLADMGALMVSEAQAPYLSLEGVEAFETLIQRHSGSARRNRSRQRRRLSERGALAFDYRTRGAEAETLTALAFAYKAVWLDARGLYSRAFSDPRTARFFADVSRAETRPAGCYVAALASGGHTAAIEVGVRCKGRSAIHIVTYDLAYEKAAAGALLMEDSIRRALADGMTGFDFLPPGYDYKWEWADSSVAVRDWAVPLSPIGRLYTTLYLRGLRGVVKRGVEAMPLPVRRKIATLLKR